MNKQRILDTRTISYNRGREAGERDAYNYIERDSQQWAIAAVVANCDAHYAAGYQDGLGYSG
jgi:hypothetical protein